MNVRKIELKVESEKLENMVDYLFFQNDSKGKIIEGRTISITPEDSTMYSILKNMDNYKAKLTNKIIDGGISFNVKTEKENSITLEPLNKFCVYRKKTYSFY